MEIHHLLFWGMFGLTVEVIFTALIGLITIILQSNVKKSEQVYEDG